MSEKINPVGEFDAMIWANAFGQTLQENPNIVSKDTMLGWFANAIMAGYDRAKNENSAELARRDDIITRLDGDNKSMRHIFSLWRKTEAIKEIDRLKEIVARLKEDGERLVTYIETRTEDGIIWRCNGCDKILTAGSEGHSHLCPITLHRQLMKELE